MHFNNYLYISFEIAIQIVVLKFQEFSESSKYSIRRLTKSRMPVCIPVIHKGIFILFSFHIGRNYFIAFNFSINHVLSDQIIMFVNTSRVNQLGYFIWFFGLIRYFWILFILFEYFPIQNEFMVRNNITMIFNFHDNFLNCGQGFHEKYLNFEIFYRWRLSSRIKILISRIILY